MKPLYTSEQFNLTSSEEKLPISCYACGKSFLKRKAYIVQTLSHKNCKSPCCEYCKLYSNACKFCCKKCFNKMKFTGEKLNCLQCNEMFYKTKYEIKKTKNHFCSSSCAAIYNNAHKTTGTRRSKLEIWLEEQLKLNYPNLEFKFNEKSTINSELDIFIPELNLAFEINGIFHYKPIYGLEKLTKIQINDKLKLQKCLEQKIELCTINISSLRQFKPEKAKQYFEIIQNIINKSGAGKLHPAHL